MDLIFHQEQLNAQAVSSMLGYLAQRSNVCAKVIGRDREIVAVNRRGLQLLQTEADDICGAVWTTFWQGDARAAAETALEQAFGGKPASFVGHFDLKGQDTVWEVDILPLEWAMGEVVSVIAISNNITATQAKDVEAETLRTFSEALHAMANVVSVSSSSARLLRKRGGDALTESLADGLAEAATRAQAQLEELRAALGKPKS
ncbi:PAS domain-containing protein [Tropicibacter naphthalenivorans]|uniref:PAS fold protein n=1 Tax=Tropicibacter naphthalenivorans TaxID=441103 RepID=A0A0P1G1K3_9RHOB|nr:PAS domain-containing protein [Tropicibacter naphthalenivorans]CUH75591.1 PAS fold protein [Tropicibacter naphthalenivorans]SMC43327.1 PAS fold-containing protein [Tropicibacter naphthalenivorans]